MNTTQFLRARIAEDERSVLDARYITADTINATTGEVLSAHNTTKTAEPPFPGFNVIRVLTECAAKRAIIEEFTSDPDYDEYPLNTCRDKVLNIMAAVYADHPDCNPNWKTP